MSKIFPPGAGRDLFLSNCTSCHAFVCSVEGQRSADNWGPIKANHMDKVAGLSEADYNTLFAYLIANFNDKTPAPKLPPELAGMVCSAQ
jgi:mono/diheme cytochrome c family protein